MSSCGVKEKDIDVVMIEGNYIDHPRDTAGINHYSFCGENNNRHNEVINDLLRVRPLALID